jgi:hypothetical protein
MDGETTVLVLYSHPAIILGLTLTQHRSHVNSAATRRRAQAQFHRPRKSSLTTPIALPLVSVSVSVSRVLHNSRAVHG